MNLNLHYDSDPVNLEMVRIKGSMPAERVENLVKETIARVWPQDARHCCSYNRWS